MAWDGDRVTFTYRARQEEAEAGPASAQRITLPVADFLQRWLLHVPVPQTRVVRCYGLYHQTHTEALAVCRTALGQAPVEVPVSLDWQTLCAQRGRPIPSGVPPVAGGSCVRVSSRGGAPAGAGWRARGMKPTHARRQGEIGQGCGLSGVGPVVSRRGQGRGLGGSAGQGLHPAAPQGRLAGLVAGGRARG